MYYKSLLEKVKKCANMKVPISRELRIKYKELYAENPHMFRHNATEQHYMLMKKWVFDGKVWRVALMGFTRNGKSEVGQTNAMLYIDIYNYAYDNGVFEEYTKQGIEYNMERLEPLTVKQILFSQSNYLYELREQQKANKIILGYPRIIDEDETSIGGLGSMSEKFEIDNINNISAQTIQSEWQIRPDKFILKNTVYGLYQEYMDRTNKINWSMLYEIRIDPSTSETFRFLGWVATPLHEDEKLRKEYNKKKKENIIKVIEGTADLRLIERIKVARLICEDSLFKQRTTTGLKFLLSKYQQECVLNEWIINKKVHNFNQLEKQEIIEHARMIAEKKHGELMRNEK